MTTGEDQDLEPWLMFLRRHGGMMLAMLAAAAVAVVAAIYVFLWVVEGAQTSGLVPAALGEWTVGFFFTFILALIFWELVLVGSWAIAIAVALWGLWYRRLPAEERAEYEGGPTRRRSAREGSGMSLLVTVIWFVVVWTDGNWDLAFQSWTFNDWVYSWVAALLWSLLIVAIPGLMFLAWSFAKARGRGPVQV